MLAALPIPLWTTESDLVSEGEVAEAEIVTSTEQPVGSATRKGGQKLDSWVWFFLVSAVLVAACFLEVRAEGRVGIWGQDWVLPESCFTKYLVGIPCPGCGLTRSFIYLAHGEFAAAWQVNWTGCFLFLYAACQVPLALAHAFTSRENWRRPGIFRTVIRCNEFAIIGILLLLSARWVFLIPSMFGS